MRLFGKDLTFYNLLESQAEAAHRAASIFHDLSKDFSRLQEYVEQIVRIEKEADEITHQLARRADMTFVTPLDKEDLRALSSSLDDVTDAIEAAANRLILYRLTVPRPDIEPMVGLLVKITGLTHEAVAGLARSQGREEMQELFIRIHGVENDSDRAFRQALQDLFDSPNPDALMVLKWKEIYDRIEIAADQCETIADILESIMVKYA